MISAIIILVLLGMMDLMLFVACVSLEEEMDDEEQMEYLKEWREEHERSNSKADK